MLMSVATHGYVGSADYESLRNEWLEHPTLKDKVPECIKNSCTLNEFRYFIKDFGDFQQRRFQVRKLFRPVLSEFKRPSVRIKREPIKGKLSVYTVDTVEEAWKDALRRRKSAPEETLVSARTLMKSVCKHVLQEVGHSVEDESDLFNLINTVASHLPLALTKDSEQAFKQIISTSLYILKDLEDYVRRRKETNNKERLPRLSQHHAELAINIAGSISTFLLATLNDKQQKEKSGSPNEAEYGESQAGSRRRLEIRMSFKPDCRPLFVYLEHV